MSEPLVSVLVVTYNHRNFIHEAVTSAADQDYSNLEVVVADDGSSDGTDELVLELAHRYPAGRVVPIVGEGHLGVTGNCNRVLRRCRGKYLALFAGDDIMLPGKISRQVEWLEAHEKRVMAGHDVEIFDSDTGRMLALFSNLMRPRGGRGPRQFLLRIAPIPPASLMVRMAVVPAHGFDERIPVNSDWKFWIDCLPEDGEYGYIPEVLVRHRRHVGNVTKTPLSNRYPDLFTTVAIVAATRPRYAGDALVGLRRLFRMKGVAHLRRGEFDEGRRYIWLSARGSMLLQWKTWVALTLSILPSALIDRIVARERIFE